MRAAASLLKQGRTSRRHAPAEGGFLVLIASEGALFDPEPAELSCFLPALAAAFGGAGDRSAGDSSAGDSSVPIPEEVLAEVWRFVRLDSRWRGQDRYRSLARALRLLERRPEAASQRGRLASTAAALEAWLSAGPEPSAARLAAATADCRRPALARVRAWSDDVDERLSRLPPAEPYPEARAALRGLALESSLRLAAPPSPACRRGLKGLGVRFSTQGSPIEARPRTLVVGDTVASLEAARAARLAFFPIVPGAEGESWELLAETGFPRFLKGETAPSRGLLASFLRALPAEAPWKKGESARAAARP